jgi:hypothetical protein
MGRPLNKSRMSITTGGEGVAGKIEVTAYYPTGGSLLQDDNAYIVSQRSSRKFKIHQANSTVAVFILKGKAPNELSEGEFCVKITIRNDDSSVVQDAYVTRFYNRIVHYAYNNGANTGSVKYTLGTEAGEDSTVSGSGSIDVL